MSREGEKIYPQEGSRNVAESHLLLKAFGGVGDDRLEFGITVERLKIGVIEDCFGILGSCSAPARFGGRFHPGR